jgi:eukaryotic-like serine/threonine-protein kinase
MKQQFTAAADTPELEPYLVSIQSDTEAYYGRLRNTRSFARGASEFAKRRNSIEESALQQASEGLEEAEVGNDSRAREAEVSALALASTQDVQLRAALAFARAGDVAQSQSLGDSLNRRFAIDTLIQSFYLPTIEAAIALRQNNAAKAIELLDSTRQYELGADRTMYPVYLRGEAYLQRKEGPQAAAEFQKIIDHRGIVQNFLLGALAYLQLGRAKVIAGDKDGARNSYQDFLTLWKDADPDIPILKQAKAEYAKLQ